MDRDPGKDRESYGGGEATLVPFQKGSNSILPTDLLREMGREAMNAPPPSKLERRSSKESAVKKLETRKKPNTRNALKELNSGSFHPLASGGVPKSGCFRFLLSDSSGKESSSRAKPLLRTPRSAPPNRRNAGFNPNNSANPSRYRASQKTASKSNLELPKQLGSRIPSKPKPSDFLQRWSKRKPSSSDRNADPKVDFDRVHGVSCLSSSPERTLLGFDAYAAAEERKEAEQKLTSTPTSATTPPVQASISPEVPMEFSVVSATPVCFAKGYVVAGVHDRRKCRPRGMLTTGGSDGGNELESENVHRGVTDLTRISVTPPPLAGASIHWLSSPSENINSSLCDSFGSSAKGHVARCPTEASVDSLLPPSVDGQGVPKDEFLMRTSPSPDHGFWRFSSHNSSGEKSSQLGGLSSLNSFGLETTPSSGIGIQKTPRTGSSISPFSLILESIAKTSKIRYIRPQSEREAHLYGSSALKHSPSYSSSTKKYNSSPSPQRKDGSFQFGCSAAPSNSLDLNHYPYPSFDRFSMLNKISAKEKVFPCSDTRISWREGLVSRIFEMGELDCFQWLSDDEDNLNNQEEDRVESTAALKIETESSGSFTKSQNEHTAPIGFGSVEFVLQAEKNSVKVSLQGPTSFAESISLEGLALDSSDDSDWKFSYKNHLFEEVESVWRLSDDHQQNRFQAADVKMDSIVWSFQSYLSTSSGDLQVFTELMKQLRDLHAMSGLSGIFSE